MDDKIIKTDYVHVYHCRFNATSTNKQKILKNSQSIFISICFYFVCLFLSYNLFLSCMFVCFYVCVLIFSRFLSIFIFYLSLFLLFFFSL